MNKQESIKDCDDFGPSVHLEGRTSEETHEWLRDASIVHIAPLWLPLDPKQRAYGGAEDVALNNIIALNSHGVREQVVFGHPKNISFNSAFRSTEFHAPLGIPDDMDLIDILRKHSELAAEIEEQYVRRTYDQIRRNLLDVSVIHDHTIAGRNYGNSLASVGIPVIRTEHGPLIYPITTIEEESRLREFEGNRGMQFVAISHDQRSQMPNLNWTMVNGGVNYNGVDIANFDFEEDKSDYLLYLGRVNFDKGIHNAIELAKVTNHRLIIAGPIERTPQGSEFYERYIFPQIDNDQIVHNTEGVRGREKARLLAKAKALIVLNEWREPFGMVIAEAHASGTPVIGSAKGSLPELIDDGTTGYLVDNVDEAQLALKEIEKGKYDPHKARKFAEAQLSKEAMARGYAQIYMSADRKYKN